MADFITDTLTFDTALKKRLAELHEALQQVEAEKAGIARRHEAIALAAFHASGLDLASIGADTLLGHLVQLNAKADDAIFKKTATDRAQPFIERFENEVAVRSVVAIYQIDASIDIKSDTPVPVIARIIGRISDQQAERLKRAGLTVKINASRRTPLTTADGDITTAAIVDLAETMDVRFDLRPKKIVIDDEGERDHSESPDTKVPVGPEEPHAIEPTQPGPVNPNQGRPGSFVNRPGTRSTSNTSAAVESNGD